jgi:hypothetical protein
MNNYSLHVKIPFRNLPCCLYYEDIYYHSCFSHIFFYQGDKVLVAILEISHVTYCLIGGDCTNVRNDYYITRHITHLDVL